MLKTFKQLRESFGFDRDEMSDHAEIFDKSVSASPSEIHNGTKALHQWTMGGRYYRPLQNILRHGNIQGTSTNTIKTAVPEGNEDDTHPTKTLHGMKNAIDTLLNKTSLSKGLTGRRAIDSDVYDSYTKAASTGDTVVDKGYTAFSTGKHVSDVSRTHSVKVVVPAGHKALPMMHVSSAPHEGEVLVARNSIWKPVMNGNQMEIHLMGHKNEEK